MFEGTEYDGPEFEGPIVTLPPDLVSGPMFVHDAKSMPDAWHRFSWIEEKIWPIATGKDIVIGNLDTGYNEHRFGPEILSAKSYIRGQTAADGNGHGTHTIGSHSCKRDDAGHSIGTAPDSAVRVYKVLSNGGSGSSGGIAQAIRDATDDGCHIVTMSLGGGSEYIPQNESIDYAWSKGCWVTASAGNSGGTNTVGYPARYHNCICVGAYREDGSIASFSSGGRELDWACPGQNVVSFSTNGSGFGTKSGTSMSNPIGAGHLACLYDIWRRQGRPSFRSAQDMRNYFKMVLKDAGRPGFDVHFGFGTPDEKFLMEAILKDLVPGA